MVSELYQSVKLNWANHQAKCERSNLNSVQINLTLIFLTVLRNISVTCLWYIYIYIYIYIYVKTFYKHHLCPCHMCELHSIETYQTWECDSIKWSETPWTSFETNYTTNRRFLKALKHYNSRMHSVSEKNVWCRTVGWNLLCLTYDKQ